MMKKFIQVFLFSLCIQQAGAQTWIWYPGDYEIWLANQMQNRRTEKGTFFPVFWKMDNHYVLMDFHKVFNLSAPEDVEIHAEGTYNVKLDGKPLEGMPRSIRVPAGTHKINIKVFCQQYVPAVFVKGKTIVSDGSWLTTFEDKEWIDETGKTSDISATEWARAGYWDFNDPRKPPSAFRLPVQPMKAVRKEKTGNGWLCDFGKETFGYIRLHNLKGKGGLTLYYGESREEALSAEHCETFDRLRIDQAGARDSVLPLTKAFRYVYLVTDPGVSCADISMLYEYADLKDKGSFRCSDTAINRIYEVAKYTLHLSTREFFVDGIKRDRWIWSGDAYQSYLMNFYLMNDHPTVKRTIYALRGKDPVTAHINTIMDYTFYWFLGIYDYYLYSGDKAFLLQNYGRMKSLMDYVQGRKNSNGLLEGLPGDWIFIDWAAGLSKKGEVSFEQLLFARSLETMAICAEIAGEKQQAAVYGEQAASLKKRLFEWYWNEDKQALVHSRVDGKPTENVTRYANMFAIFFDYFTEQQKQSVKKSVLLNNNIQKITTPYMRFYELEALCAMGEQDYVRKEMKNYWGGMLQLGATSFWEEYNPDKSGTGHYEMYGRKFGKSLCHAWGASPVYLLGKYYLGVKPTSPGFATWDMKPELGGLEWMEGKVPTPEGEINVYVSRDQIRVTGAAGTGTLRFSSRSTPVCAEGGIQKISDGQYMLQVHKGRQYTVRYTL